MTVRDICMTCVTDLLYITFDQDPTKADWDICIRPHSEITNATMVLQDWILDHEVHLMSTKNDNIFISLFTYGDKD